MKAPPGSDGSVPPPSVAGAFPAYSSPAASAETVDCSTSTSVSGSGPSWPAPRPACPKLILAAPARYSLTELSSVTSPEMFGYKISCGAWPGDGHGLRLCLMSLALRFGADHGYAGSTQARPAFIVLAVVCAVAAAVGQPRMGGERARHAREVDLSGADR